MSGWLKGVRISAAVTRQPGGTPRSSLALVYTKLKESQPSGNAKNDFNISPSRYIHTGEGEEYRPIAGIVEELDELEAEARETDAALRNVLAKVLAK